MTLELVRVKADDGVRLEGTLTRPGGGASPSLPFDVAVLHHGVGGTFYNQNFFEHMTGELLERGVAVLRVNNRGHDLMYNSPTGRLGAAFEGMDDSRRDWRAWNDFAASQGFTRICVWGHSLGAVKSIYYQAKEQDERVVRMVASSPPRFSYSTYLGMDTGGKFQGTFEQAQAKVAAGEGDSLIAISVPTNAILAARTVVEKYGPAEGYDFMKHLPAITGIPALVTLGGEEGKGPDAPDWLGFGGSATRVASLAEGQSNLAFRLIPGADHGYNNRFGELWTAVEEWLAGS